MPGDRAKIDLTPRCRFREAPSRAPIVIEADVPRVWSEVGAVGRSPGACPAATLANRETAQRTSRNEHANGVRRNVEHKVGQRERFRIGHRVRPQSHVSQRVIEPRPDLICDRFDRRTSVGGGEKAVVERIIDQQRDRRQHAQF